MAFVVITMAVVMLSGIFLFKAGNLTAEKIQLQNAADAVAYSVSVLEARDLNYMSYMNRAMIANEVAVGQLVGLLSWASHIGSIGTFIKWYDTTFLAGPTLTTSTAILWPIATVFAAVGYALKGTLLVWPGYSRSRVKFLSRLSSYYGYAQLAYHGTTVMLIVSAIHELVPRNAPGATLSDFGLLSLVGHTLSYANKFTTTYNPESGSSKHTAGYQRFAAKVHSSKDPFTRDRGWRAHLPGFPQNGCWDIADAVKDFLGSTIAKALGSVIPKGCIDIDIRLDRLGGSELRFIETSQGNNFNWSAADNTAFNLDLGFSLDFPRWINRLGVPDINVNLPALGAPFSAGVAQNGLRLIWYPDSIPESIAGTVPLDAYGEAPDSLVPWMFLWAGAKKPQKPPKAGAKSATETAKQGAKNGAKKSAGKTMAKKFSSILLAAFGLGIAEGNAVKFQTSADVAYILNQFGAGYQGLPQYTDTNKFSGWGHEAPYFLVGLTKSMDRVNNLDPTSPDYHANGPVLPTGRLALDDAAADNEIASIAKSEVYFQRPVRSDLSYFARSDDRIESGSAFNPYWQARLVDTAFADRVVSLLLQQQQAWDPGLGTTNLPSPAELSDLPTMVD